MSNVLIDRSALEPSGAALQLIRTGMRCRRRDSRWESACRTFLEAWEPTIRWLARRYAPRGSFHADFAQVGRMALVRAVLKFPANGERCFIPYARRSVRNALIDEARRVQARGRERELDVEVGPQAPDCTLAQVIRTEAGQIVRHRIGRWRRRLQVVVDLLFVQELSQAEIADRLGLTPARISQLWRDIRRAGRDQLIDLVETSD